MLAASSREIPALNSGGAISNNGGNLLLNTSTFFGNRANGEGGAVHNLNGTATITRCTFAGQTAQRGGAIFNQGSLQLVNSIVAENSATTAGPDIFNFENSVLDASSAPNIIGDNSDSDVAAVSGRIGTAESPVRHELAPLAHYGGPTRSMHPLVGSPALLSSSTTASDQRGFVTDGQEALGAVKPGAITTVTTTADDGAGSLRAALAAATTPGAIIQFAIGEPAGTITLNSGELSIPATSGLFIDASNITGRITISGNHQSRVFSIPADATVAMHSLTIRDGNSLDGQDGQDGQNGVDDQDGRSGEDGEDGQNGQDGGGILNNGTLSLIASTVSNNQTGNGGDGGQGGDGG